MSYNKNFVRNFSIIAHIDHGKSTLADRLIEETGAVSKREMEEQFLDNMELEKERGITIKLKAVKLFYKAKDGNDYILNLIDTPGHVDFTYEVSRSLAACEGALLVVDASQGVEAQTLANVYLALEQDLEILPVINKIDLPSARPDEIKKEIEEIIGLDAENTPLVSAKEGINITDILEDIVHNIPAPEGNDNEPLKALIFDSYYDSYKGVVSYVRIFDGELKEGMQIRMMSSGKVFEVTEVGYNSGKQNKIEKLHTGDVGYFIASIKNVSDSRVGDTVTDDENPAKTALPGYKKARASALCVDRALDSCERARNAAFRLCAYRPRKGFEKFSRHGKARAQKYTASGHKLSRPHVCRHRYRLGCRRTSIPRAGYRKFFC